MTIMRVVVAIMITVMLEMIIPSGIANANSHKDKATIKHTKIKDPSILKLTKQSKRISDSLVAKGSVYKLTVSAYTTAYNETHNRTKMTALQEKAIPGIGTAISRDLENKLAGKTVWIQSKGIRRVNDLMAKNIKIRGKRVPIRRSMDLLVNTKKEAIKFGKQELIVIVLN